MKKLCILLIVLFILNIVNAQWTQQISGATDRLYSVCFTDANTGYAVGGKENPATSLILKTTNGGIDWIPQISGTSFPLCTVNFTSIDTGYVVGYGAILKTTNGGTNWTQSIGANYLRSGFFIGATGYAVGSDGSGNGIILKTTNSGTDWVIKSSMAFSAMFSVYFTDVNTGYVVGDGCTFGFILKTTDGGANWTTYTGAPYALYSVYFASTDTGYVVGAAGTIIKTTNGGVNWTSQSIASFTSLTSVYFTDANTGYAVGPSETVLKTTNGGSNWFVYASNTSSRLYFVCFSDFNTGYAVGDSGTIIKTTNGGVWVKEKNKEETLKIYPIPTNNKLTIETTQLTKESTLTILNINGQELIKQKLTETKTQIDISNLTNGIYFVKLITDKTVEVRKIIKK